MRGDLVHHRAANYHGIGVLHDETSLFRIGNAEANGNRRCRKRSKRSQEILEIRGQFLALAGYARSRYRVEKTIRGLSNLFHPLRRTCRRDEKDRVQARAAHGSNKRFGFLDGQISCQYAVKARGHCILRQLFQSMIEERIEITEQDQRDFRFLADILAQPEHLLKRDAVAERTIRRALDHRTIRDRVGERNSQFDQVRARLVQRKDEFQCYIEARITRRDVRDKRFSTFRSELLEPFFNARHASTSSLR